MMKIVMISIIFESHNVNPYGEQLQNAVAVLVFRPLWLKFVK